MRSGASFDDSGAYRYTLWRAWDKSRPKLAFVMLNPSTADHRVDDPTIRRCQGFARSWGYGSLTVVNLFAFRTPSPAELARADDPIGPRNDHVLRACSRRAAALVLAWGVHGKLRDRHRQVLELFAGRRRPLLCLGTTRDGYPRHPLYLRRDTRPQRWSP
jgi:hypothetical protein